MAKYYKLEQADLRSKGHTRDTYRVLHEHCTTGEEFVEHIASHTPYSKSLLTAVLIEVAKELGEQLATGDSVTLPGIGIFSIGVKAKAEKEPDEEHELNAQSIEFDHVNFRCSKDLKNDVASRCHLAGFERVYGKEGKKIKSPAMLIKGRMATARQFLESHPFMRITDYAERVGLSYTAAQRELKEASHDSDYGIRAVGRGNQRVYVLADKEP